MAIYGYARCSTNEDKQDINRQIRELKSAGAEEVVFEFEHGDAKVKKELHMLLDMATEGDTIITLEVSRLSRSTQQLCEIIDVMLCQYLSVKTMLESAFIFPQLTYISNTMHFQK
ncbi:MAG: recombinase family protein [Bacteroidaceae bacterium]|nr:recombinase family protein [Bacteroidaceae bacterium]